MARRRPAVAPRRRTQATTIRGGREGQRRHRGIDVEAALPAAQAEEEHDEGHPAQQEKEASVSPNEPASPGGDQPRQAGDGGEPDHRDHLHQEEPEGLAMLPRPDHALRGLSQEKVPRVRVERRIPGAADADEQRDEPGPDRRQQQDRPGQPAPVRPDGRETPEAAPPSVEVRDQEEEREEAHALRHDAQSHRDGGHRVPAPGGPPAEMPDKPVQSERRPEDEERIGLAVPQDQQALDRRQEQEPSGEAHPPVPEPTTEVVHADRAEDASQEPGEAEGHAWRAGQLTEERQHPHEERRLVGIGLGCPVRDQPGAVLQHLEGDSEEPLLVDAPWVAEADSGPHDDDCQADEDQQVAARPETRGHASASRGNDR